MYLGKTGDTIVPIDPKFVDLTSGKLFRPGGIMANPHSFVEFTEYVFPDIPFLFILYSLEF
jgi:hypothetical protein